MQWKVRRTLAFSLHELALILGDTITCADLVPVFDEFLKDLDEVRIGVLKHLADFLKLLRPEMRRAYLPKLSEFLTTDNSRNWRFHKDLAEQMLPLLELYSPTDILEHLVALALAEDKVVQVRLSTLSVLSGILLQLSPDVCRQQWDVFVSKLTHLFAESSVWAKRQIFAQLCGGLLDSPAMDPQRFCAELLPLLLSLRSDRVPNVRISLARTLVEHAAKYEYYFSESNPRRQDLLTTFDTLRNDSDPDVKQLMHSLVNSSTSSSYVCPSLGSDDHSTEAPTASTLGGDTGVTNAVTSSDDVVSQSVASEGQSLAAESSTGQPTEEEEEEILRVTEGTEVVTEKSAK